MIKAEWQYLWRHKFILIVLIVIEFIPSIYAVTFLKSMWDPYGKLQALPVAVVNHDQATMYHGTRWAAGQHLTKSLAKSTAMDFKVMGARQATKKLHHGQVYMVLTIPRNFSKNATTLMQAKPEKMVLQAATSAGHNYTASKMTTSAAKTATDQVAAQVTRTYAKTMFSSIKSLGIGMSKAGQANQKLADGSQQAVVADRKITTGLTQLAASTLTLNTGNKQLVIGLNHYLKGVDQALSGSQKLASGVKSYTTGVTQANQAAEKLATGSAILQTGTWGYVNGVEQANTGVQTLQQNLTTLNQKTTALTHGTAELASNSQQFEQGLKQLNAGSQQLTTALDQIQLAANHNTWTTQLNQLFDQLAQSLSHNAETTQLVAIKAAIAQVKQVVTEAQPNDELASKVASTADTQKLTAAQKQAILATVTANQPSTANTAVTTALAQLDQVVSAGARPEQTETELATLKQVLQTTTSDQKTLGNKLAALSVGSQTLTAKLQAATLGFQTLNQGTQTLATQTPALTAGTQKLANGATGLASGMTNLTSASDGLLSGTSQLVNGNQQLASGTRQLSQNGASLQQGATSLTSGLSTLAQQGPTLTNGATQLSFGAMQLATGSERLAQGGSQLANGLTQVQNGNHQLGTTLATTGEQASIRPTQLTYDQLAKPTTTRTDDSDDAQNNGTGMAPYMMSVSLFVGALAFNMMFDMYTPRKYPKNGFRWWTGKGSILAVFAFGEAVLIEGLLILIDGLAPIHPWATFGLLISIALAFMSIVYWLNLVFGKVGAFFSMILLVLQLGGSAGTYPIQLSNHFFQTIHPWLPMSYAVSGLRNTLMVGNSAWPQIGVLLSILVIFSIFSMLFYGRRHGRIKAIDFSEDIQSR
ncbi:YhgE/Pip family protein [Lactiplantibacillus daoliensis]|uniref:YhgE/Pip family protein n=1 Tax=Lactiplantibacillus daoliensis TaxID=2559916 RepID=A0ABW1UEB6_9LACO|nr:YhgE/Pip domain-containing protein [Lactiplantibacillus daoliensis]